jgi:N-acetylglucosaminyldiphosphoundecaprenol N-acetyl-beta-D-mannosaminyltransferase
VKIHVIRLENAVGERVEAMRFKFGTDEIIVNIVTNSLLVEQISRCLKHREGFALATLNLDHLTKLTNMPDFRKAYGAQDFVVADGNPIVWLSRIAGTPVELMPGSDLVVPLARLAETAGVPVALVGSTAEILAHAATRLEQEVPGIRIVLQLAPAFGFDPTDKVAHGVLEQIKLSGAGLCFLALGAPKQEILAARGRKVCPNVGFASIGAGLDFLGDAQTRAPRWVQKLALEWLWRIGSNPVRLGPRYARSFLVLPGHVFAAMRQRMKK